MLSDGERTLPKEIPRLPRLREDKDLIEWSRQLVDFLQDIFIGKISAIDGRAIVDKSIPAGKMEP